MRKWLLLIVIIIVVALLGMPYAMGIMAKSQIMQLAANGSKTPNMQVHVTQYNRGWFKSKAEIDVAVQVPDKRAAINGVPQPLMRTIRFKINENIIHGPIIFKDGIRLGQGYVRSNIEMTTQQQQMLQNLFIVQGLLPHAVVSMLINLSGAVVTHVDVPAFTLVAKSDKTTVKWLGLNGYWHVTSDMKKIKGRLTVDGVNANNPQMQLQMGKLDVKYHETEDSAGIWVGNVTMDFPSLVITKAQQIAFSLTGLKMTSDSNINMQKLLDTNLSVDLANVKANGLSYGPASYQSSIKNLDTQVLLKIQNQLQAANNATMSQQQKSVLMMSIWPLVPEVFNKGAVYDLQKLMVTLPEGVVNANGKITMPTTKSGEALSIMQLYGKIDANFTVEAPVAVAKKSLVSMMVRRIEQQQTLQAALTKQLQQQQASGVQQNAPVFTPLTQQQIQTQAEQAADNQLNQWLVAGFVVKQNDNYKLVAQLQQGKLIINGKTLFGDNAANQPMMAPGPVLPQNQNATSTTAQPAAASQQTVNPAAATPSTAVAPAVNQQVPQNATTPVTTINVAPTAATVQPVAPATVTVQPQPSADASTTATVQPQPSADASTTATVQAQPSADAPTTATVQAQPSAADAPTTVTGQPQPAAETPAQQPAAVNQ